WHEDIVKEILVQVDNSKTILKIDDHLPVLQNRSVRWLWNAYKAVNKEELVK
ncbi:hypothetical protein L208DRAFT_1158803, partial [Tricholoma matsutake]